MSLYENPPYYITAYGLAVKRGYRGTIDEWLASLKGEPGRGVKLRYNANTSCVEWAAVDTEDWQELFPLEELIDPVVAEVLEEAKGHAGAAAQSKEQASLSAQVAGAAREGAEGAEAAAGASASAANLGAVRAERAAETAANAADEAKTALGVIGDAVAQHDTSVRAHNDLRLELQALRGYVTTLLDSDDTTLDQLSEIVAYIKSNRSLIDAVTTAKVSTDDIVNDLVTNVADRPLSAAMGVRLKSALDQMVSRMGFTQADAGKLAVIGSGGALTALEVGENLEVKDGKLNATGGGGSGGNGSGQNVTLYIGPDEPTGDNRPLYWLDTSMDDAPVRPEEPDVPAEPDEPEKTLTGIAAVYTGGSVPVGTAVSALTGITVTASYSDGSTATVTGYTLSGSIAEGSNTVTVTYQGKTATFAVTGVTQSGGEELPDVSSFILHEPWLTNLSALTGEDVTSRNNPPMVAAGTAEENIPITEYLDSNYDVLYAVHYRPTATDAYGAATGWNAQIQEDFYGEKRFKAVGGNIPHSSGVSTIDGNKLFVFKLAKADALAAIGATEYTSADIIGIILTIPSGLSKNYNAKSVWMAEVPTTAQQQALVNFFENGGEL